MSIATMNPKESYTTGTPPPMPERRVSRAVARWWREERIRQDRRRWVRRAERAFR